LNLDKPCKEWQGAVNNKGYGKLAVKGLDWLAHRYEYTKEHGHIPKGLIVRHLCNNKLCIEIEHLALGTYQDNTDDQRRSGSQIGRKGNSPRAAKIADILEGKMTAEQIAVKHKTSRGAINKLRKTLEPR